VRAPDRSGCILDLLAQFHGLDLARCVVEDILQVMVDVVPADADRTARWLSEFAARMSAWFSPLGFDGSPAGRVAAWERADQRVLGLLVNDGVSIGHVAAVRRHTNVSNSFFSDAAAIYDIWVDPAFRRCGMGQAARAYIEQWARELGTPVLAVWVWQDDPGVPLLFADYPLRSRQMVKPLGIAPSSRTGSWAYRPMKAGQEYEEWQARGILGYAAEISGSGSLSAESAREAAVRSYDELLPQRLGTRGHSIYVVEDHGAPVADIWLRHGEAPGVAYVFNVEVHPGHRGHGYGRAAMLVGEDLAREGGDSFLALNVFGHNRVAMRLYESLGYQTVEEVRAVEL
jgi:ribosomal protein S18 acetylase RimI-like enzyme